MADALSLSRVADLREVGITGPAASAIAGFFGNLDEEENAELEALPQPLPLLLPAPSPEAEPELDEPEPEGKIHRVDPDFEPTLTVSNRDSQSNRWVNWKMMGQPCEFQVRSRGPARWRGSTRRRCWPGSARCRG